MTTPDVELVPPSLLTDAAARAQKHLDGVASRSVAPTDEALAGLAHFDGPLPAEGTSPADVLAELDAHGSPATMLSNGGRFFGFVNGGTLPAALAANWLATAWDQNAALSVMSPVAAKLDEVAVRWLVELFGFDAGVGGGLVTGATGANIAGLAAARHRLLADVGWDVDADGLFGAPPVTVIVGGEVHPSLQKSLGILGFGRRRVVSVPADDQGRMLAEHFPNKLDGPTIVCLQAGNVNSGASDPFAEIIPAAQQQGAWVHIDGAFGLWALTATARAHLVAGVEHADSWATDAHKWLNTPYDCGVVLTRHPDDLAAAMSMTASYLASDGGREPIDYTSEMSRRARGVEVWAALRQLGRAGVDELIEGCCRHATNLAEGLAAGGFDVLNDVVLNQVVVASGDTAAMAATVDRIQSGTECWAGPTTWQGRPALRLSVSSWATTDRDIERAVAAIVEARG